LNWFVLWMESLCPSRSLVWFAPFRLTEGSKDYIVVGSDSGRILVILEYNRTDLQPNMHSWSLVYRLNQEIQLSIILIILDFIFESGLMTAIMSRFPRKDLITDLHGKCASVVTTDQPHFLWWVWRIDVQM
jgi:hypothetical protein